LGPIKVPPKHNAYSVGHFLHSPGLSIFLRENEVIAGHSRHWPDSVNFSPSAQGLSCISSLKALSYEV